MTPPRLWATRLPGSYPAAPVAAEASGQKGFAVPAPFQATLNHAHHHTAIRVRDFDRMVRFYRDVMGIPYIRQIDDGGTPRVVWLRAVQLIRSDAPGNAAEGTMDHLAISVLNIEAIVERLKAEGTPLEGPIQHLEVPAIGEKVDNVFFRDPDGNRVELVQWTPL